MTRRALFISLTGGVSARLSASPHVPTDPDALNAFARQYGVYIDALRNNVVDLKQWARVVRAWRRVTDDAS